MLKNISGLNFWIETKRRPGPRQAPIDWVSASALLFIFSCQIAWIVVNLF